MPFSNSQEGTASVRTKWLVLFSDIIYIHFENSIKLTNTLCGENAESLINKTRGTFTTLL
jgi:hypothetical protein